jgi:hypothetical protein
MTKDALDDLLTRWAAGELSETEFAALEQVLLADAGARRRLRQHALLDEALRELPEPATGAPGGFLHVEWPSWMPFGGGRVSLWLAAGLIFFVGWMAWQLGARESRTGPPTGAQAAQKVAPLPAISGLRSDSGSATLSLDRIGTITVQGPADFNLVGPMRARLTRGRIKVRITEPAGHGFIVETPDGEVTDLGTEFGLEVIDGKQSGVVVFQGAVDLRVMKTRAAETDHVERLEGGDGVTFTRGGETSRIPCIVTGEDATFRLSDDQRPDGTPPVIVGVADNLNVKETKRFYEIVPGGLREDALAYVDRIGHEWNGCTKKGMPAYLVGADYVKTFNQDRTQKKMRIEVTLSRPAKLYVFYDKRLPTPDWLRKGFSTTRDVIGMDEGPFIVRGKPNERPRAIGPGNSIDSRFAVWERTVTKSGAVKLGPNMASTTSAAMYGIAAVAWEEKAAKKETAEASKAAAQ